MTDENLSDENIKAISNTESEMENPTSTKKLTLNVERSKKWKENSDLEVWCDGRRYEPDTEAYHPIYSYRIKTKDWTYEGNDIIGGANETPNLVRAMQSLIAFLHACGKARTKESENFNLFPEHVREWAIYASDELTMKYHQITGSEA